ncbi:MAG: cation transporter [Coriobacteriales bacterium]|jgi:copper chaperone CopZ|nr:cation transporter [Coriobacteriales bacterium]
MEKLTLRVEGMACEHCENALQDAVRKLPGIKKVKANRRKCVVEVVYDDALTEPDAIAQTVADTGFEVV